MEYEILNILFSLLILSYSIRTFYVTYNEPSSFSSTNFKGYSSGFMFSILSIMSIFGAFDLFRTFIDICKITFEIKTEKKGIIFALFVFLIFVVFGIIYYRPNKIFMRYKLLLNDENYAKNKLIIDSTLYYLTILILSSYLIIKILNYI
jgi:hypothetical protein